MSKGCAYLVTISWVIISTFTPVLAAESVKIGVIQPFTGITALWGDEAKRGIEMAMEKINAAGGVLKKKVELALEDSKGDPSTAVSAAERLIMREKVVALTGVYSSTEALAVLAAVKKYEPLFLLQGGATTKIDRMYGKEPWLFMLLPRSPDYQKNIAEFLNSIQPKPKRIALAYEDTSYGVDHSRVAKEYLTQLGFELVTFEPFKSGALDHSSLVTKIKGAKPDIFYWIGYAGDSILMTKQAKELGFSPKMLVDSAGVGLPEFGASLQQDAEYVCGLEVWIPTAKFPASGQYPQFYPRTEDWVAEYKRRFNKDPQWWSAFNYVALITLTTAMNKAGTTDKAKLITALEATDTMTPFGPLKFFKNSFGAIHQSYQDMIVFQWQKGEKVTLWPPKAAGGKLLYPMPAWDKRS